MIKPHSMLVEFEMIAAAKATLAERGPYPLLEQLAKQEPALGQYVGEAAMIIAGKTALCGAPTEVTRGVHQDLVGLVMVCLGAVRRGTYEVWQDTEVGACVVAALDDCEPKPRRRRKAAQSAPAVDTVEQKDKDGQS